MKHPRFVWRKNRLIYRIPASSDPVDALLTEAGDELLTEGGENIVLEG